VRAPQRSHKVVRCEPTGGYSLPPFSVLGAHSHHSSLGIGSMTIGTCEPQPHHVFLPVVGDA